MPSGPGSRLKVIAEVGVETAIEDVVEYGVKFGGWLKQN